MARKVFAVMQSDVDAPFVFAWRQKDDWAIHAEDDYRPKSDDDVVVFAPATDVTLLKAVLPTRSDREAIKVAPFAVEDEVAQSADDIHVALGMKAGLNTARALAVCARTKMDAWQERLNRADLKTARLVPEQAVLPTEDVVLDAGERLLFSIGSQRFGMDASMPDDLLQALSSDAATLIGDGLQSRLARPSEALPFPHAVCALAEWAEAQEHLMDLFQGPYARRQSGPAVDLSSWQVPGAIAAATALVWVAATGIESWQYAAGAQSASTAAADRYVQTFPNDARPSNPTLAARQKFMAVTGDTDRGALDFVAASAGLYEALGQSNDVQLISMRYSAQDQSLRAQLGYPDYGEDVQLKLRLEAMGFRVINGDLRQSGSQIVGDLTLEAAS